MLCTLIGAIILSINIQVGLNIHLYDDIGMHRHPFEGRHLVNIKSDFDTFLTPQMSIENKSFRSLIPSPPL